MIMFLIVKIKQLFKLPKFLYNIIKDVILWFKEKWWLNFYGWGLHLFVGKFGAGKTSTMVKKAYELCKKYPQLTILTNLKLNNFPTHTKVLRLTNIEQIKNAPKNTLVLIDEIGTIFNSRDFVNSNGKSVPKIVFQHLCQCRKRNLMIFGTTQRWNFLDKQLRDITATVTTSRMYASHPFSRMCTCFKYDAVDYDLSFTNPVYTPTPLACDVYIQTDFVRGLYGTEELMNTMLDADYLSDLEILENRGEVVSSPFDLSRQAQAKIRKSKTK